MLYLLFVLTFLAGILFYGLSPSDKKLDMTANQAESMIITFLTQHQAAKDYLYTWLGAGPNDEANDYSNIQRNGTGYFLKPEFEKMELAWEKGGRESLDSGKYGLGIVSDMCAGNIGLPGTNGCKDENNNPIPGFISQVVCTDATGNNTANCNALDSRRYVITYGGWECKKDAGGDCIPNIYDRPSWWPAKGQKMRKFESWRKAIAKRTRDSISCGTLVEVSANVWCIDNGKATYKKETDTTVCRNQVPAAVISSLSNLGYGTNGLDDLLFCMSEFEQGLENYYPGATYFYDALSNNGIGIYKPKGPTDATGTWVNLTGGTDLTWTEQATTPVTAINTYKGRLALGGLLNTPIQLGPRYTLTVLLQAYSAGPVPCGILQTTDRTANLTAADLADPAHFKTIMKKLDTTGRIDNTDTIELTSTDGHEYTASICNMNRSGYSTGIVSWTFVVDGTKVDIYENAIKRSRLSNKDIVSTNGEYLILGDRGGQAVNLYGIRYYPDKLTPEQIQQNFKVDQKRFSIPDINNSKTGNSCVNDTGAIGGIPQVQEQTGGGA